ncbi:MAG: sulfite exporter TauE/SafE family protein [Pseudomonadota bacterium]
MPLDLSLALFVAAAALAFFAGLVKGITGFALPMIMISGIGSFLAPETALAGLILPTLVANVWQAIRQGLRAAFASALKHWRYVAIALVCLVISAQFVTVIPTSTLFLVLGIPVTFFAALQLVGWRPKIDPAQRKRTEIAVGAFAGGLGGLSGVWGPPTVLYLTALNIPKIEHVRVQGVVYSSGAIALALAHVKSGVLHWDSFVFSALLVLPAILGVAAGFAIQDRLDQERFRLAVLVVLAVAGLNLIRRGVFS